MVKKKIETVEKEVGTDIRNGSRTKIQVPVEAPPRDWKTEDREEYTVKAHITGSLNGRKFDLKKGDKVHMNEDEANLFADYLED